MKIINESTYPWFINNSIKDDGTGLFLTKDGRYQKCHYTQADEMGFEDAQKAFNTLSKRVKSPPKSMQYFIESAGSVSIKYKDDEKQGHSVRTLTATTLDELKDKISSYCISFEDVVDQEGMSKEELKSLFEGITLTELVSESKFVDPQRLFVDLRLSDEIKSAEELFGQILRSTLSQLTDSIFVRPEVLVDNRDGTYQICLPGREDFMRSIRSKLSTISNKVVVK